MRRVTSLYRSSVGKKIVMALTGIVLFGFVVGHMIGNLNVFLGAEHFDAYARFLRTVGEPAFPHGSLLWIARIALLASVGVHIAAAVQLTLQSRAARGVSYQKKDDLSFSYASRTMRWGGAILAAFVVYHLMHLTFGNAHPAFDHASPYRNVVTGFQSVPVVVAYVIALAMLCFHLYHGLWSATQTLACTNPRVLQWRRPAAAAVALVICLGFVVVPVAVLAGFVK